MVMFLLPSGLCGFLYPTLSLSIFLVMLVALQENPMPYSYWVATVKMLGKKWNKAEHGDWVGGFANQNAFPDTFFYCGSLIMEITFYPKTL